MPDMMELMTKPIYMNLLMTSKAVKMTNMKMIKLMSRRPTVPTTWFRTPQPRQARCILASKPHSSRWGITAGIAFILQINGRKPIWPAKKCCNLYQLAEVN